MALNVDFLGTTLFEGLSAESGDWTGTDGISLEVKEQGPSSEGWIVAKNGNETAIFDYYTYNGSAAADMSATDTHLFLHMKCDIAPFMDYLWVGISSDATGATNYKDWQVVDNTTTIEWGGGWKTFVIDLAATADRSNGTVTMTDIRSIRINIDNSNSGNIRSIENTYLDVCRFGTGIQAYDDAAATAFDIGDIEAIANNATNKFGVIEYEGGTFKVRAGITIGSTDTSTYANFVSSDEFVVFLDPSVSGESRSSGLYKLAFIGNATNQTTVSVGTKVGSGDTMLGRNGTAFVGESASVSCTVTMDANVAIDWYGGGFRQLGGLITLDDLDSGDELASVEFGGCDQVDIGAGVVRNVNILNTVAAATSGALKWVNGTINIKNSSFINNAVAIEVVSLTADMTFVGMEFTGNTNDVRYEGATDWDLNWSDASGAPTIQNASTGTLSPVNTVNTTITGVPSGAEWRLYVKDPATGKIGTTELDGAESHTGGDIVYSDNYTSNTDAALQVMADGYIEYLRYFILGSAAQTVDVILTPETNE